MKELIEALALALTGFPPMLGNILAAGGGALVSVIVAVRVSTIPLSTGDIAGQFLVCWLTGGILGPSLFTPVVQSLVKLPEYAVCFLSSGIGWWFWTKFVPKKQEELLNKKEGETPPTP